MKPTNVSSEAAGSVTVDPADAPPAASNQAGMARRLAGRVLDLGGPLVVFGAFLCVWYLLALVVVASHRRFLVPPPHNVLLTLVRPDARMEPLNGLWQTTKVSLTGLALAIAMGGTSRSS